MTTQEALHKALKVLNCLNNDRPYETAWVKGAITACKEALQSQEQENEASSLREPVAWMSGGGWLTKLKSEAQLWVTKGGSAIPLYTHPKEWQELSDDEIDCLEHNDFTCWGRDDLVIFARAILAKAKEKNT